MPQLHFHISTSAPARSAKTWGDTAFAAHLAQALADLGHGTTLYTLFEPIRPTGTGDVVLRIAGPHLDDPVPGLPNIAWLISHIDRAPMGLLRAYQSVCAAARNLSPRDLPVIPLEQGTDTQLFTPERRDPGQPLRDIVFVGNYNPARGKRQIVLDVAATGHDLAVWGHGWDGKLPDGVWRGKHLSLTELADVYANARIVLNSHMERMAKLGAMSNRTFDALASGALVLSDAVHGYDTGQIEGLHLSSGTAETNRMVTELLAQEDHQDHRTARAARLRATLDMAPRAAQLAREAAALIDSETVAEAVVPPPPKTRPNPAGGPVAVVFEDPAEQALAAANCPAGFFLTEPEALADLPKSTSVHLFMADPDTMPQDAPETAGLPGQAAMILRLGTAISLASDLKLTIHGPDRAPPPLAAMADAARSCRIPAWIGPARHARHQLMVALLNDPAQLTSTETLDTLTRSRRVARWLAAGSTAYHDDLALRLWSGRPVFASRVEDGPPERMKDHAQLSPRRAPVRLDRPLGVFLHLFYDDLAPIFAERLAAIDHPMQLYLTTDSDGKADTLARSFPGAQIAVIPNRGRDIYAKLWAHPGAHDNHDVVLHLHGKRSRHTAKLDSWMAHILSCIAPNSAGCNRILSLFDSTPTLGIVAPKIFKPVLPACHWGLNHSIAEGLAPALALNGLPGEDRLRFPAGSMFWARTDALRPLLDLNLSPGDFPPEVGQLDGTLAHAIERLFGVVCEAQGYDLLFAEFEKDGNFGRYRFAPENNRALRDWLAARRAQ